MIFHDIVGIVIVDDFAVLFTHCWGMYGSLSSAR